MIYPLETLILSTLFCSALSRGWQGAAISLKTLFATFPYTLRGQ